MPEIRPHGAYEGTLLGKYQDGLCLCDRLVSYTMDYIFNIRGETEDLEHSELYDEVQATLLKCEEMLRHVRSSLAIKRRGP